MKAKELAITLKKIAKILELYDDTPILEVLDEIYFLSSTKNRKRKKEKDNINIDVAEIKNVMNLMNSMNVEDISKFLTTNETLQKKKNLQEIAKLLNISSSNRQTKDTLQHSIMKYYERMNIDRAIRVTRNE